MKVTLVRDRCVGAGQCVLSSPEVFDQDEDDGVAYLLCEEPLPGNEDSVHEAVDLCPAQAILVAADGNGAS